MLPDGQISSTLVFQALCLTDCFVREDFVHIASQGRATMLSNFVF